MAGRKPTPTKLKLLKGTAQKCRMNKDEPQPEVGIPSPPNHLSKDAFVEWGRVTHQLYQLGLLSDIDRSALAAYCQIYGRWVDAETQLAGTGLVITTSNGNIIQNPLVGIANKALELMHKFLTEFGMTPSSRTRVSTTKQQPKKTGFAAL